MGGPCEIRVHAPTVSLARQWLELAEAEVRRLEAKYSRYRPDSVCSAINASAGDPEAPPPDPKPAEDCLVTGSRICGRHAAGQHVVVVYEAD